MRGPAHASPRRLASVAIIATLATTLPGPTLAAELDPGALGHCRDTDRGSETTVVSRPWEAHLDDQGAVIGHGLTLRVGAHEMVLRTGRRGFASEAGAGRILVGERADRSTRLHMIDTRRACRIWSRTLEWPVYLEREGLRSGNLRFGALDPATRAFRGRLLLDPETGDSGGLIDGECIEACTPNDGDITAAALAPAGDPRPTPNFGAGGWPKNKTLAFRWRSGGVPPSWARDPMKRAADDASRTSFARSPYFVYRPDATNAVSYGASVPGYCSINGIACAGRAMPSTWGVWIRPHGTDYAWGELRWCQKTSSDRGCFDIRRVLLHELGHIAGLTHPSNAGFTLAATESVMQAITPARPGTGASRHSFGRCDVATLQELYDTPDNRTAISTCNDIVTRLTLSASETSVAPGTAVKLSAQLRVDSRPAYRQLSGNPLNGRSVKLKYRRAGSDDAWQTAWMRSTYSSGRYELSISPSARWEFKAVFPAPSDEGLRYSRSDTVNVKVQG